jgi:flagellar basal-body rod protein FlgB
MNISLIETPNIPFLERYLDLATFRQTLVAANLANIDTPGYQSRDIAFQSELNWAATQDYKSELRPFVRKVEGLIERPDGNNVSLDREGLLLSETQLQYKAAIEFIRYEFRMLRGAINDGAES